MWATSLPIHVEDMNLSSVNYLHCEPKIWYIISPRDQEKVDAFLARDIDEFHADFLKHPKILRAP